MAILDLYPAEVRVLDSSRVLQGAFSRTRVYISDAKAGVFVRGPRVIAQGETLDYDESTKILSLQDGSTWEIRESGGCGCGRRLEGFDPEALL